MSQFVIKPTRGLCNKLQVTLSYYHYCKKNGRPLVVIWETTNECPGYFLDYFEPLPGVTFMRNNNKHRYKIHYTGCADNGEFKDWGGELRLLPHVAKRLEEKRAAMGKYIAVHVRRTDHVLHAQRNGKYTPDEEFFCFIEENSDVPGLYIATDNPDTHALFRKRYPDRVKLGFPSVQVGLRKTSLEDSIIDLYMCVGAERFKGSGHSSYSDMIMRLRRLNM